MESLEKALEAWPENITVAQCIVITEYLKQNPRLSIRSVTWDKFKDVLWVTFDTSMIVMIEKNGEMHS